MIRRWIEYKREKEINPVRMRPHPMEFALYYDIYSGWQFCATFWFGAALRSLRGIGSRQDAKPQRAHESETRYKRGSNRDGQDVQDKKKVILSILSIPVPKLLRQL
ncbi:MAG TPA: hypothetical protein VNO70_11210 [Blastocatellia bacterium]|nr:hypothetical protein [Blastocatellia bacterium]